MGHYHYLITIQQPEGELSFLFDIRCPLHLDTTCILVSYADSIIVLMSVMKHMKGNMFKQNFLLVIESFKYKISKNSSVIRF